MEGLLTPPLGLMISALEVVQCILEDRTVQLQASAKHTVAATFREATALVSGVSGIPVMVQ